MKYELVTIESSPKRDILTKPSELVTFPLSEDMKALVQEMKKRVVEINGVGLAAPQIGEHVQAVVVYISDDAKSMRKDANQTVEPTAYFNPEYNPAEGAKLVSDWEGCFSVETVTGKVPRFDKIACRYQDEEGNWIEEEFHGFTARVLQHEFDHIKGVLIIDRLTEETIHGHPKDMALMRIKDMSLKEQTLMKKMIEEAISRGDESERHQVLLEILEEEMKK